MANNTVEIALKLLKKEFEKDSAAAAKAYVDSLKSIESANERLSKAQRQARTESERLNQARANLGVKSIRDQQREIAKLTASYNRLARSGTLSSKEITQAQEALRRKVAEVRGELQREEKTISALSKTLAPYIGVGASAVFAKGLASSAVTASDEYTRLNSQLKLAIDNEEALAETNQKLFNLAQDTRTEFGPVVTLYSRAARATKNLGLSQDTLLTITRSVNQAMQISGATSTEASSAILQFTQALQSGVLRGEEFNSISENGARLMQALADGMGVPIEAMRSMAEEGELTRDRIIEALTSQSGVIDKEFSKLEITVDQSLTQLSNSFKRAVSSTDTAPLVQSIKDLQTVIEDPAIITGLTSITNALVKLGTTGVKAVGQVGLGFEVVGKIVAKAAADVTEPQKDVIADLEDHIAILELLKNSVLNIAAGGTDNVIAKLNELKAYRDRLLKEQGLQTPDERASNEQAQQERVQRERVQADKIININKQITQAKEQLKQASLERDQIIAKEELKIAKDNASEILRAVRDSINDQKRAINDRVNAVRRAGQSILQVEREIANERQRIQDISLGVQEKLFERSLTGKSDTEQQAEIEARATEKLIEARKALSEGRIEEASRQAQEVQSLSDRLSNIERANALLVAGADIEKQTSEQVIASRQNAITKLKEYQQAQTQLVAFQREELAQQEANINALAERVNKLGAESPTIKIDTNIEQINQQLDQLQNKLQRLSVTGFQVGGRILGFNTGGQVGRQLIMAEDGEWYLPPDVVKHYGTNTISSLNAMRLPGFQEGGKLPGYGGGDRRLMAPQIGGYIIRKEAARLYGDGVMSAILNKKLPKFQTGGQIQNQIRINPGLLNLPGFNTGGKLTGGSVSASSIPTQRHIIEVGRSEYEIFGERDQVNGLINALNEVARGG